MDAQLSESMMAVRRTLTTVQPRQVLLVCGPPCAGKTDPGHAVCVRRAQSRPAPDRTVGEIDRWYEEFTP